MLLVGWNFFRGIIGYLRGTATLEYTGYPGYGYGYGNGNLDPASRAPWGTTGCRRSGFEALTHGPNNVAIRTLGALFGPMPGSYDGPYPTSVEARRILEAEGLPYHP
jgi:hypothetical protein